VHGGLPEETAVLQRWRSEQVVMPIHMGAHIDAAQHVDGSARQDAAAIPLERCMGDAILLDLREACATQPGYPVSIADLEAAEDRAGDEVRRGDIVILHTGHAARFGYGPEPDPTRWVEWSPGLAPDAAPWFIDRQVKLVGIDTPNVDCDLVCTSHYSFLLREMIGEPPIQIIENLVNLEAIPRPRFTFIGLPLPFVGCSGSPIRAIALV
jgi:kynurenine formamidase